ncbi:MAG: hypothetical protein WCK54_09590 [Desulfuromonadales bacterium]
MTDNDTSPRAQVEIHNKIVVLLKKINVKSTRGQNIKVLDAAAGNEIDRWSIYEIVRKCQPYCRWTKK